MKLRVAEDLSFPPQSVTETFGILAVRGAGKSNTAAVMAEEMFKAKLPFVVVDPVRAWFGLRSSEDGKSPGLPIPIFGGRRGDVPLERGAGTLMADLVVDQRLSCVLDLSDFDAEGSKKQFLLDFARRLYQRNEQPLHLFLEEADDYIPQRPMRDEAQLLRAWENIVRRGRNRGLGITLITQRSASVNKSVLTQVQTLIAMRTTGPQDIAAIREWVKYHQQSEEILASLAELKDGEAWVWSPQLLGKTVRVRFRRRETFDSGATPKMGEGAKAPATLADIDLAAVKQRMAATIEKAKAEDPRELRRQLVELRAELAKAKRNPVKDIVASGPPKRVEILVLKEAQVKRIEVTVCNVDKLAAKTLEAIAEMTKSGEALMAALRAAHRNTALPPAPYVSPRMEAVRQQQRPATGKVTAVMVSRRTEPAEGLTPAMQRILDALAFLEGIGLAQADKTQLALMADARPTSGAYFNNLGAMRTAELIIYPRPGVVALTEAGRATADAGAAPATTEELQALIRAKLPPAKWRLLEVLIGVYPKPLAKDELAARAGARETSGAYFNNLGSLRSLGLLDYPTPGQVVACPVLFLDGR